MSTAKLTFAECRYITVLCWLHAHSTTRISASFQVQTSYHHSCHDVSRLGLWYGRCLTLSRLGWSIPTIMFPLVKSAAGFTCARLAVGLAEGPFLPAVALSEYFRTGIASQLIINSDVVVVCSRGAAIPNGSLARCANTIQCARGTFRCWSSHYHGRQGWYARLGVV